MVDKNRRETFAKLSKRELAVLLVHGVETKDGGWIANAGPVSEVMKWRREEILMGLYDLWDRAQR